MKILEQNKKKGEFTLKVEDLNDLWTLYNIISKGDTVIALTQRRVVLHEGAAGERKVMKLTLDVEDVSFHEFTNRLRVKGKIMEGPDDFVSFGSYHTFNIELNQTLTIIKDIWMKHDLKRIKKTSKLSSNFIMLIIAIETGLANVFIITNYSNNKIATVSKNIPGKRYEQSMRNKYLHEFYEDIKSIIDTNITDNKVNLIIMCGPGNIKDHFIAYLKEKTNDNYLNKIRSIFASSGTESAIYETLKSKELVKLKNKVIALEDTEKVEKIITLLGKNPDLIAIGFEEIENATQMGATEQLFITDTLIRGSDKSKKLHIEGIINDVEKIGGKINILNTNHPAGEQLDNLGSIVAVLRYKI